MDSIGKVCLIGAGRMALAIAGGLVRKGYKSENVSAFDISDIAAVNFAEVTGVKLAHSAEEALIDADIAILAVKPQNIHEAIATAFPFLKDKLIISIAAGVTIETIVELSGIKRVIRVMPNTPALVGAGVSAYSPSSYVSAEDIATTEKILSAIGDVCMVNEQMMDAVTGVSGSGPAYVFDFIQALADGGVNAGLPRGIALKLATGTVFGAATMLIESGEHPAVLRDQVTSPGGTTARALSVLEKGSFRGIVSDAVIAAAARSAELGKTNTK